MSHPLVFHLLLPVILCLIADRIAQSAVMTQLPAKRRQKVYVNITNTHKNIIKKVIAEMKQSAAQKHGT
jgi:hypothetical protein